MLENTLKEQIHLLKKQLRLAMNGVVSSSMREKGLNYQLNFGVSMPQLKQIAEKFPKNHALAAYCWQANSREMKILSAMLQPIESFTPELMDERGCNMPSFEIARQYCMHVFQYMLFAEEKAIKWIQNKEENTQFIGYVLFTRLFTIKKNITPESVSLYFENAEKDLLSDDIQLNIKNEIINSLKRFGRLNSENKEKVLNFISEYEFSDNMQEKEWFQDIQFELAYFENKC